MNFELANKLESSPLGFLPDGWKLVKLKDVTTKIGSGATPRGGSSVYLSNRKNYALIRSQHVFDRRFDSEGLVFITDKHATELQKVAVQPRDVLLNITGDGITFGRACLAPKDVLPACVNQHVSIIRTDPKVCLPEYLLCYLTHPAIKGYIESFNAGGSRRAITKGHIESFEVPLPPLDEQKAIAHILGTLDDKIELNQQINQTLEAIARTLFKSWFIDFDPVRAKMDGRQPAGMDAETAALFPDEFEDSAIGKIPKGWKISPFGELLDLTIGGDWGKELPDEKHTQPIAIIRGTDIASVKAGTFSKIPRRYTTLQKIKSRALSDGDIVIEVSGGSPDQPTGRSCYVTDAILTNLDSIVVPASFCRLFRPKTSLLGIILKLHLEVLYDQGGTWIYQNQSTGISNFQTQYFLANELVLVPSMPIQKLFFNKIRSIVDKQNLGENRVLFHIRDTLLPKLLSGEICVQHTEKGMEAVV
jgi:type I restriction enzyme S subunit